ncbi:unnamed protein product [Symbiodinium sp. CCMP2592]|nr:unnamed protein product [Symbiodinium sp. CCMP2592]
MKQATSSGGEFVPLSCAYHFQGPGQLADSSRHSWRSFEVAIGSKDKHGSALSSWSQLVKGFLRRRPCQVEADVCVRRVLLCCRRSGPKNTLRGVHRMLVHRPVAKADHPELQVGSLH